MRRIPIGDAQRALATLIEGLEGTRGTVARDVARRKEVRMARHAVAAVRLAQALGTDNDEARSLRESVRSDDGQRVTLRRRSERERRRPTVKPGERWVQGRVLHADGRPARVQVRLFDRDRRNDDFLGEASTDEFGDFSIGPFHERDFRDEGEEAPLLYVIVYGPRREVLHDGKDDARPLRGQVEYLEIALQPKPATAKKKTAKAVSPARPSTGDLRGDTRLMSAGFLA